MRIAFIQEESQKKTNGFLFRILEKVCRKYHHEVFNYGVEEGKEITLDDVGAGILTGILLNSQAVDFVITGSDNGEGVLMCANAMPGVYCGYICDWLDAKLFMEMNGGNAISIPFGKNLGIGSVFFYERLFETLFETEKLVGYPKEKKEMQIKKYEELKQIKQSSHIAMENILEDLDKDFLRKMIQNDYFEENFFHYCENEKISEYLKGIIDAWEGPLL